MNLFIIPPDTCAQGGESLFLKNIYAIPVIGWNTVIVCVCPATQDIALGDHYSTEVLDDAWTASLTIHIVRKKWYHVPTQLPMNADQVPGACLKFHFKATHSE